jgi:hypothetical protein
MNTNLKMILAATAIAILASPVMAQKTDGEKQVPKVEDCVHIPFPSCGDSPRSENSPRSQNTSETDVANAYGAGTRGDLAQAEKAPAPDQQRVPNVKDCEHIQFPSCGDSPRPELDK